MNMWAAIRKFGTSTELAALSDTESGARLIARSFLRRPRQGKLKRWMEDMPEESFFFEGKTYSGLIDVRYVDDGGTKEAWVLRNVF